METRLPRIVDLAKNRAEPSTQIAALLVLRELSTISKFPRERYDESRTLFILAGLLSHNNDEIASHSLIVFGNICLAFLSPKDFQSVDVPGGKQAKEVCERFSEEYEKQTVDRAFALFRNGTEEVRCAVAAFLYVFQAN